MQDLDAAAQGRRSSQLETLTLKHTRCLHYKQEDDYNNLLKAVFSPSAST